jgi:hypothetical protein
MRNQYLFFHQVECVHDTRSHILTRRRIEIVILAVETSEMKMQRLPSYHIPASRLGMGSSLGNSSLWVNTKNSGDIERIFSVAAGKTLVGSFSVRYGLAGHSLRDFWLGIEHDARAKSYTPLEASGDGVTFDIHPAYQ